MHSNPSLPATSHAGRGAYAPIARALHWGLAILIVGMTGLGWYMTSIENDPAAGWFFRLHKSVGLLIVGLVLLRLVWRLGHSPAPLPATVPAWQLAAARMGHGLLYAAMIAMPLSGMIGAMLGKRELLFFGVPLPRLFAINHDLSEIFFSVHSVTTWVLVALVSVHALAALKHLAVDKDGVFQRMWFLN